MSAGFAYPQLGATHTWGPREMLLDRYGLNASGIAKAARLLLESK